MSDYGIIFIPGYQNFHIKIRNIFGLKNFKFYLGKYHKKMYKTLIFGLYFEWSVELVSIGCTMIFIIFSFFFLVLEFWNK